MAVHTTVSMVIIGRIKTLPLKTQPFPVTLTHKYYTEGSAFVVIIIIRGDHGLVRKKTASINESLQPTLQGGKVALAQSQEEDETDLESARWSFLWGLLFCGRRAWRLPMSISAKYSDLTAG